LQATTLGCEPSPIELFVETHVRSDDCQKEMRQFIDSQAQHFLVLWFSTIFFNLLFTRIWLFYFYFHETYNSWLKKRHEDDPSIHPDFDLDLWLEARSFDGPNRNLVYELSNTTTENLWTARSVSIIRCLQSIPSTQSLEFVALLDQRVQKHTTSMKTMNYSLRIIKNSAKWTWIWDHRWVVYVYPFIGPTVPETTSLLLL
jgi:hypothetical protein